MGHKIEAVLFIYLSYTRQYPWERFAAEADLAVSNRDSLLLFLLLFLFLLLLRLVLFLMLLLLFLLCFYCCS